MVLFVSWLIVMLTFVYAYREIHKPLPRMIVGFFAFSSILFACMELVGDGALWIRSELAGLWIMAALGLIVLRTRLAGHRAGTPDTMLPGRVGAFAIGGANLETRFRSLGFSVTAGIEQDQWTFDYVAYRKAFDPNCLRSLETYFIVRRFEHLDASTLAEHCGACSAFVRRDNRRPASWIQRLRHARLDYPVALVCGVQETLGQAVTRHRPADRAELPLVIDIANNRAYCWDAADDFPDMTEYGCHFARARALEILGEQTR